MELLDEYIDICKMFGALTEWIQGPGGNFSIKNKNNIIIKRSGTLVSAVTQDNNWMLCDIGKIKECILMGNEDAISSVIKGNGKPSIEVFLHCISSKFVLHFHPTPLLGLLCSNLINSYSKLDRYCCKIIEYYKPGLELAKQIDDTSYDIYFLKNHGVIIHGNTVDEIINKMKVISYNLFPKTTPSSNIDTVYTIYRTIKELTSKYYIIKPFYNTNIIDINQITRFNPYTPDIVVFLQSKPLHIDDTNIKNIKNNITKYYIDENNIPSVIILNNMYYTIGLTHEQCISINEILISYIEIIRNSVCNITHLSTSDVNSLINWDKEKERKQLNTI
jgi:rhamnose utilization protein RhaD (predicted bifunctional aldolase and dehydrogenase)